MIKYIHIYLLYLSSLFAITSLESCIADKNDREIIRNQFTFHETIESENFVIHFTTSSTDSQYVNGQWYNLQSNYSYAQSIIDHAESALSIYINNGWEAPPPDCDETITDFNSPNHCVNFGGNSLYDIYISNDAAGMVVPENPYPVEPYIGGMTSFMKISTLLNEYQTIPSWNEHVVAHELHHSIQLRYGYSVSGSPGNYIYNGWLFEQTATYMENVIYPNSMHLRLMLSNCNVVTPLTYPHYNIDYPAEIYPYRSALWQKFLVESIGDSSIIRYIWEDYGLNYSTGEQVSLFPIYSDAVEYASNGEKNLTQSYADYAIWRYFTGERSISNLFFDEASFYCTSSAESIVDTSFTIQANKGASIFIEMPSEDTDVYVTSDFPNEISLSLVSINPHNEFDIIALNYENNNFIGNLTSSNQNILIANSKYNNNDIEQISFTVFLESDTIIGDTNTDGSVDILDVILVVNQILNDDYSNIGDLNSDNSLDVIDIVLLMEIILNY